MYIKKCSYAQAAFYMDNLKYYKIPFKWQIETKTDAHFISVEEITPGNIHVICDLFLPENDIHYPEFGGDLYIRVTKESKKIISELKPKSLLTTFTDNIDHVLWYDLPFCKNTKLIKRRTEQ
jgi:hypothetical protein